MEVCCRCLGEFEYPLNSGYCYSCASNELDELESENISLAVEEKEENNYCSIFDNVVPDDAMMVGVLIKCEKLPEEAEDFDFCSEIGFMTIRDFLLKKYKCRMIACVAGIHLEGKRQKRHIHYNFIMTSFKLPTNNSKTKKAYLTEIGEEEFCDNGYKTSFKFEKINLDKPKYLHLCYPFKEGHVVENAQGRQVNMFQGVRMKKEMIEFLKGVGNTIYEQEKALNERREKHETKIKNQRLELLQFGRSGKFANMAEFIRAVNDQYIKNMGFSDRPNSRNLAEDIKQVGFEIGLCDLV